MLRLSRQIKRQGNAFSSLLERFWVRYSGIVVSRPEWITFRSPSGRQRLTSSLIFPFPSPPLLGHAIEITPGVLWTRTSLGPPLEFINHWLIRDHGGWVQVDCGYPNSSVKAELEAIWANVLEGLPISRVIVTHQHVDHVGNCAWVCERWGVQPSITRAEYEGSQYVLTPAWTQRNPQHIAFFCRHGLSAELAQTVVNNWSAGREQFVALPAQWEPLQDNDVLQIGDYEWRVMTGRGHAPEQALLLAPQLNLLIAGDQILPKISPHVGVFSAIPDAQLDAFLTSNRRIAEVCASGILVLPSHGMPFRGLRARVQEIERHHEDRLDAIREALHLGPQPAAHLIPHIFRPGLDALQTVLAMSEILAHLYHLLGRGRVRSFDQDGVCLFAAS